MWIASTLGFFAISWSDRNGQFEIMARRKADLQNLLNAGLTGTLARADHFPRLAITPDELPRFYALLATLVDYGDFQARIQALPDQADKESFYRSIQQATRDYQARVRLAEASEHGFGEAITPDEVETVDDYQQRAYQEWLRLQGK
ncbi:hypothetical protein GCM10027578_25990 [Spirosoma luteolum]